MATERYFVCKCQQPSAAVRLFDALRDIATGHDRTCPKCETLRELHLVFNFGLEGGSPECRVLAVFAPTGPGATWPTAKGETVTFFPLLVVLESDEQHIWLPYWHTVEKSGELRLKYGQWAPFMSAGTFRNLLDQAHQRGYLGAIAA
jgi:hypothetical protein